MKIIKIILISGLIIIPYLINAAVEQQDPHSILGIEKNASDTDIKKACNEKYLALHPDKPGGDQAKFMEVRNACEILLGKTTPKNQTSPEMQAFENYRKAFQELRPTFPKGKAGDIATIEALINKNVLDVNMILPTIDFGILSEIQRKKCNKTMLQEAAYIGDVALVELLLKNNADVHMRDDQNHQALYCAIPNETIKPQEQQDYLAIAKALLKYKAEPTLEVICTALERNQKEIVELLVEHGAPTTGICELSATEGESSIESLAKANGLQELFGIETSKGDEEALSGQLFNAIGNNNSAKVESLLEQGANPNKYHNVKGLFPLHVAIEKQLIPIIATLLKHGADANLYSKNALANLSPLGVVFFSKGQSFGKPFTEDDIKIVDLLLENGANPNLKVEPNPQFEATSKPVWKALIRWDDYHYPEDATILRAIIKSLIARGAIITNKELSGNRKEVQMLHNIRKELIAEQKKDASKKVLWEREP